jgi:acetylornithine aminotransferase
LDVPLNTYDYPSIWREEAEENLRQFYPDYQFAFLNGGAEAVEAAIKIARYLVPRKQKVAAFRGCFHGKTFLTGLLTDGKESEYTTILPYAAPIVPPVDTAAIVVEPFQCRNGVLLPDEPCKFFDQISTLERAYGIFVIDDEISTGLRSGAPLAIQGFAPGFLPAIVCLGKNIGQGFPVSAVGVRNDLLPRLEGLSLTSGYGGNALACVAIAESLSEFNRADRLSTIRDTGVDFLHDLLVASYDDKCIHKLPGVKDVRGIGMWFGIEFFQADAAKTVAEKLITREYIVGSVPPRIRLAPPFDLSRDCWKEFCGVLRETIQEVCGS